MMWPTLIDSPRVGSYGVMVLLGVAAAWWLARRQAPAVGITTHQMDRLAPLLIVSGLAGAWLAGWLAQLDAGRILYGALLLPVGVGVGYCLWTGTVMGDLGDAVAAPMALGIAFGRVGCFLAGCCWGVRCDWPGYFAAVHFPPGSWAYRQHVSLGLITDTAPHSLAVHPVQLYEAAGALLLCAALIALRPRRKVCGEVFLALGVGYAALRFVMEFLRADNPRIMLGLTLSQIIAVVTAAVCIALFITRRALYAPAAAA